jgi:hypothetical protein
VNPWDQHLRIGDAERERAAAELADHYAAGRITTAEHSERLDQIWAAKTPADLAPVFADLPRPGLRPPAPGPAAPLTTQRRRRRMPGPLVALIAILVAITVVTHLPLVLIAVAAWFLLTRSGGCRSSRRQPHWRY